MSNRMVIPVALTLICVRKCPCSRDPSEPVPCKLKMAVAVKFWIFWFSPSQLVKCPVKVGCVGSSGTNTKSPVMVSVMCPVPVVESMVTWTTPLKVSVTVPVTPVQGLLAGKVWVMWWNVWVKVTVFAFTLVAVTSSKATTAKKTSAPIRMCLTCIVSSLGMFVVESRSFYIFTVFLLSRKCLPKPPCFDSLKSCILWLSELDL